MAIFTGTLATDPPSDLAKLANDGRITLVSATEIKWDGSVIGLSDGTSWKVCKPSSIPNAANTATDLNGTALGTEKVYDVFMNYTNTTSCSLAFSRWAAHTAGSSSRNAAYAAGTAYAIGDRVTSGGKDYTCIQAGTGQTPSSSPTYWVDNGTSVTGDFAGLYRHDGVLVSHNSDAGKKLRWLGVIYTYNNSNVVNFKDEITFVGISNFYNRKATKVYKLYDPEPNYTLASSSSFRAVGGAASNTETIILMCVSDIISSSLQYSSANSGGSWGIDVKMFADSTEMMLLPNPFTTYTDVVSAGFSVVSSGVRSVYLQERVAYSDTSKSGQFAHFRYSLRVER